METWVKLRVSMTVTGEDNRTKKSERHSFKEEEKPEAGGGEP